MLADPRGQLGPKNELRESRVDLRFVSLGVTTPDPFPGHGTRKAGEFVHQLQTLHRRQPPQRGKLRSERLARCVTATEHERSIGRCAATRPPVPRRSKHGDCGLLEHGFARVRCEVCRAEFLVAFRCKGRQFCPSCHARRLSEWSLWLEESLLLDVPHRQIVLTLPKRLRPYLLYDRRRLGGLSRLAARVLSRYLQAALGDRDAAPGAIICVQTFGSIAHWHPHLHVLITDGAFTRDARFHPAPTHD